MKVEGSLTWIDDQVRHYTLPSRVALSERCTLPDVKRVVCGKSCGSHRTKCIPQVFVTTIVSTLTRSTLAQEQGPARHWQTSVRECLLPPAPTQVDFGPRAG